MIFFIKRESCPACESSNHRLIYQCGFDQSPIRPYLESYYGLHVRPIELDYLNGAKFELCECNNCGLVFQREIPNDFLMKKLYEEWIDQKKELEFFRHMKLDYHAENAREIMMLIAYLNYGPSKLHFLDVGMGWGNWGRMVKAFGCNICGIELSLPKIEFGRSQNINVITWDKLERYSFDFVNTEQFFEHVDKPLEVLRALTKVLKPNGLIKISVPNGGDIKQRLKFSDWTAPRGTKNSLMAVHPLEHINCYNRESIIKMSQIAGLHEVRIPIGLQYIYSTNWKPGREMIKNLLRPLYYNVLKKGTYLFFSHI